MTEDHRDSAKALEKALSLFHEASAAKKCRACGCFHGLLRALANDGRFDGFSEEFTEAVIKAQECLTEMQYDCFGCEVCFPPLIVNSLSQVIGDDLAELDICPGEKVEERPGWPPLPGSYIIRRFFAPVAVCSLMDENLAQTIARESGANLSIAGTLCTENLGIERLIHNVLANSHIRHLILCGPDSQQAVGHFPGQSLLALAKNGVDQSRRIMGAQGRRPILKNISKEAVEYFHQTVTVVDLIGQTDVAKIMGMVETCAAQTSEPAVPFQPMARLEPIPGYLPNRMVSDPAGYFVIYVDLGRGVLSLEHYLNNGLLDTVIEGTTAAELYTPAIERGLISRLDHAAYLGRELTRAEESLHSGKPFVQDAAPELAAPLALASVPCGPACHENRA